MFTKKSLILGLVLLLALACAGTISTFAASATPILQSEETQYLNAGIPAIPPFAHGNSLLSLSDVQRYLKDNGITGVSTLNDLAPTIQSVELTNIANVNRLEHIVIPRTPVHQEVYYTKLKGPFTLSSSLPLPVLETLLPGLSNLSITSNMPNIGSLLDLPRLLGFNSPNGNLLNHLLGMNNAVPRHQPSSSSQPGTHPSLSNGSQSNGTPLLNGGSLLSNHPLTNTLHTLYAVFDAHTGNLLAWG